MPSVLRKFGVPGGSAGTVVAVGLCTLALGLVAGSSAHAAGFDNADGSYVDAFGSQDMLLPKSTLRGATSVKLTAAKNEYESFRSWCGPISGMSASLRSILAGPGGATIPSGTCASRGRRITASRR